MIEEKNLPLKIFLQQSLSTLKKLFQIIKFFLFFIFILLAYFLLFNDLLSPLIEKRKFCFVRSLWPILTPSCRKFDFKKSDFSKIYDHCNVNMIKTPFFGHKMSKSVLFFNFRFFKKSQNTTLFENRLLSP